MIKSVVEKISAKQSSLSGNAQVTIAFLGDSVTQGCFELVETGEKSFDTVYDVENAYSNKLKKLINTFFPKVYVNVINAGISGDSAAGGLKRIERDVLKYSPDLTVVAFGLNDCVGRDVKDYEENMRDMFSRLKKAGTEVIFMSTNGMNEYVSPKIKQPVQIECAEKTKACQQDGILGMFYDAARRAARQEGAFVCDCYGRWEQLSNSGADMTALLANGINHPTRDMHWLFAVSLFEMIFFD